NWRVEIARIAQHLLDRLLHALRQRHFSLEITDDAQVSRSHVRGGHDEQRDDHEYDQAHDQYRPALSPGTSHCGISRRPLTSTRRATPLNKCFLNGSLKGPTTPARPRLYVLVSTYFEVSWVATAMKLSRTLTTLVQSATAGVI